jgi:hypothetical protein
MGTETPTPSPQYQQVTVDVPEDRVAEFHAFFARFLAGRSGRLHHRGRHGRAGHGPCGHRGSERRAGREAPGSATGDAPADITEV